ncbi:MAG: RNA-directed DNA polymerase [Gammaproteobacteria bacterium]|nr:RNA-directed DNA polymerase [Gammaproteobacteria bacterium]
MAEFYFYDLTYRYRSTFRRSRSNRRKHFGYRFAKGEMVSPARSYRRFRRAVRDALVEYRYCVKADIAQYFNSLYHHDLVAWFRDYAKTSEDVDLFGKFLRQINAGRSVDCLPHGIYPAKIVGSQFLRFVDNSNRIVARKMLRFMDDIYLFDSSEDVLKQDFHQLQRLLGEKGLSVNESKTQIGEVEELDIEDEVDDIKSRLLERRSAIVFGSGVEEETEDDEYDEEDVLDDESVDYLLDLLRDEHLEEEDAELILAVMREHSEDVLEHIPTLLRRFPALSKSVYHFSAYVKDTTELLSIVRSHIREADYVTEFQLFWLAKLCEGYLLDESGVGDIFADLLHHQSATVISKAKVLEIPEGRFGMPDLREEELRTGASGWLSWAAAVGSRKVRRASRNHLLGYFANGSAINRLISDCVRAI